ncbi:MAG: UDP-N-acetylmuramoyl-tripeptide--D-alanyl-D-alanine ligase, partial [Caldithrix sp.]|nr:UDP-N-acetylmuramoyl-tripeptide--D-alanyl-D-alanine ligase [Caldithrix sp.]
KHMWEKLSLPLAIVPDTLQALQQLAQIHRKRFEIPVISITGSNGKTTVKEMLATILNGKRLVHKTAGNLNNHIGCPLTLMQLKASHEAAVIELGTNHPGEIELLAQITKPTDAIITNIGPAHLEFFKDLAGVTREKLALFKETPAGGTIYKNLDDPNISGYKNADVQHITYSLNKPADVRGRLHKVNEQGRGIFRLNDKTDIQLKTPGLHNVYNALAAAAVALNTGFDEFEIKDALEDYYSYDQRMQIEHWHGATIINDSYNANPESMRMALQTLENIQTSGRIFIVIGDMFELGEDAIIQHQRIIEESLQLHPGGVFVIGPLMHQACNNIIPKDGTDLVSFESHDAIRMRLSRELKANDIVLIKGSRGMKMEKIIQGLIT